jgi:hypothetical protein
MQPVWVRQSKILSSGELRFNMQSRNLFELVLSSGMQSAGMKVLRVWLDGESTSTTKGTTITSYSDLEVTAPGDFEDQVLDLLDGVMVTAHLYGIKVRQKRLSSSVTKLIEMQFSSWLVCTAGMPLPDPTFMGSGTGM